MKASPYPPTLRKALLECVKAIEAGERDVREGTKVYRQQFGEAFLEYLKAALGADKSPNVTT